MARLSVEERKKVLNRLSRIEGQVRGVARMIEGDKYCIDILTQLSAASTALDQVGLKLLDGHVRGCVRDAMLAEDGEDEQKVAELLQAVESFARMR